MELNHKTTAENLYRLRGDRTKKEVADAVGVTEKSISQYEHGERIPNDAVKVRLAAYYNKTAEELFYNS